MTATSRCFVTRRNSHEKTERMPFRGRGAQRLDASGLWSRSIPERSRLAVLGSVFSLGQTSITRFD